MYSHVITTRNVRSASQQTPQWPRSRFSWTLRQRRWKRWSQLDTRRWSPGDRRKRRHTSLQQRRHKSGRLLGDTWIVIAGSIIPAFSSVNECLFNSRSRGEPHQTLFPLSRWHRLRRTSVCGQRQVLELSVWHHCFGREVWGWLSNLCIACSHFQSDQMTETIRDYIKISTVCCCICAGKLWLSTIFTEHKKIRSLLLLMLTKFSSADAA